MVTKVRTQIHMDDIVIDDVELSQMLEERESAKEAARAYRVIDKKVRDKIQSMEQQPPFRIDRWVIGKTETQSKSVSFETLPGTRISIKLLSEE